MRCMGLVRKRGLSGLGANLSWERCGKRGWSLQAHPVYHRHMRPIVVRRLVFLTLFCFCVAALAGGIWRYGYVQALGQLQSRGEADLRLASDRLTRNLQRFQELVVLMAEHPALAQVHENGKTSQAKSLLLEAADKTSALDLLYVDRSGRVLVSAHDDRPERILDAPYFRRAMNGALGAHHDVSEDTGQRVYYFAAPSFGADGRVQGALVVLVDVDEIEFDWRGGRPAVYFTDEQRVVFVTNRSEMLLWRVRGDAGQFVGPDGAEHARRVFWVGPYELWRLDWGPYLPKRALHITLPLPVIGLTGEALVDVSPALRLAGLQAAVAAALCLAAGAMLFLVAERRRVLAEQNAKLEQRVHKRTEALSTAVVQLEREVRERQEAQAALTRAQEELVQAGKLSALGQMSAGISHELNQPLMAIRSFAENGSLFLERGKVEQAAGNLERISDLSRRMGRIIKNLRAFARNESEAITTVDVVAIIEGALDLNAARRARSGISLEWYAPEHPVWVRGGEVRLGQVMLNLITNACDAMEGTEHRNLTIAVTERAEVVEIVVEDSGPGIEAPDKIFEPFYSTKEVGASEGMGLGLSISYGLIQSFGGAIRGENLLGADGRLQGARFALQLVRGVRGKDHEEAV